MRPSSFSVPVLLALALLAACADDGTDGRPPGADGGAGASAGGGVAGTGALGGSAGAGNGASAGSAGSTSPTAGTGGSTSPTAGTGGSTSPTAGTGGSTSPNGGTGGSSSPIGGAGGASPPNGGNGGGPSPAAGSGGSAGSGAGGAKPCVGEVDDTEPNDSLASAYDLGTLQPEFESDCGGTLPQTSFDGAIGPGDVDYAKVVGAEKMVKCSHHPKLLVFEKTKANACLVAKCDDGTASYTCKGGAGADLGNGYYGCCGDLSKDTQVSLEQFTCSGSKGSAKLIVKIAPLANAMTCEPYGVLVTF